MSKILFISGIPTAGKSHLAKLVVKKTDALYLSTDVLRKKITNPVAREWVRFYKNQDEDLYYLVTSPEKQWENLETQSKIIWPFLRDMIKSEMKFHEKIVVEGVSLLPELVQDDFHKAGIMILGKTRDETLARIKKFPRWVKEEHLQELQADAFFFIERPKYDEEAKKYGWKIFEDNLDALKTALDYLN